MARNRIDFVATNRNADKFREDASFVYRCDNLARGLRAVGWQTRLEHIRNYEPSPDTAAVVLHRPRHSLRFLWLIGKLRLARTHIFADIDDLIFDPQLAFSSPAVRNGILPAHKIAKQFSSHQRALMLVDHITVSTAPLRGHVRRMFPGKATTVIYNSVHELWTDGADAEPPPPQADRKVLLYMPGTRSHDRDFQQIAGVLAPFLDDHPEVTLDITGHLDSLKTGALARYTRSRGGDIPPQIVHTPKVPFANYGQRFRDGWVNLSPLEPTPFNECKSALKIIEAGYWNIPTLCSPNPDADRFAGAGAVIAAEPSQWRDALESLLDASTHRALTVGLRQRILARADARDQAEKLLAAVETMRVPPLLSRGALLQTPTGHRLLPASIGRLTGHRRRRAGLYDAHTLNLYYNAWENAPNPRNLLAYAKFRRDLGHALTAHHAAQLIAGIDRLSRTGTRTALNMLVESGHADRVTSALPRAQIEPFAETSPAIAQVTTVHHPGQSSRMHQLAGISRDQAIWRTEFASFLAEHRGSICVVGNAGSLVGKNLGSRIDSHNVVVRFNHYCSAQSRPADIGERTDAWVRAPDLGRIELPNAGRPGWVILSGPDPIYQLADWSAILPLLAEGMKVITVPLATWQRLVAVLQAPPSAGALFLAWAIELVGTASALTAAGFQSRQADVAGRGYHQALRDHVASERHHWAAERVLLGQWQREGLERLGE